MSPGSPRPLRAERPLEAVRQALAVGRAQPRVRMHKLVDPKRHFPLEDLFGGLVSLLLRPLPFGEIEHGANGRTGIRPALIQNRRLGSVMDSSLNVARAWRADDMPHWSAVTLPDALHQSYALRRGRCGDFPNGAESSARGRLVPRQERRSHPQLSGTTNAPPTGVMAAARIATTLEQRALPADSRNRTHEALRQALLVCGIASSLLYAGMIWAIRYEGYSPISQVPSELTAIGAPTQVLWARLGWMYTVLVAAFGVGVWRSAGRSRTVRIVGGLILAYASLGLVWPFAAMHQREVLAAGGSTLSDTLHVVLGAVTVFLMFLAIGCGATAFGKRFQLYSITTIVVLLVFGGLTFVEAPRLEANLPTPWIGLWERINISVFLLWVVVLAVTLWRNVGARKLTPRVLATRTMAAWRAS